MVHAYCNRFWHHRMRYDIQWPEILLREHVYLDHDLVVWRTLTEHVVACEFCYHIYQYAILQCFLHCKTLYWYFRCLQGRCIVTLCEHMCRASNQSVSTWIISESLWWLIVWWWITYPSTSTWDGDWSSTILQNKYSRKNKQTILWTLKTPL